MIDIYFEIKIVWPYLSLHANTNQFTIEESIYLKNTLTIKKSY